MSYKVKQEDLKGDIKDFPIEVVQKMVDEQVRQGNEADVSVFQERSNSLKGDFGFDWFYTREGHEFWRDVVYTKNFDLFFSKYPKQSDLKECNSKYDKVVVKEKKVIKRTFKKLSEVKLLVTNRNRKAVIAFLDEVCEKRWTPSHLESELLTENTRAMLFFDGNDVNDWAMCNGDFYTGSEIERVFVKLRDIKRIHSREESRKQRELEKTKLFCETVKENVSHPESEVKKVYLNPFLTDEAIEKIKEFIDKVAEIKNKIGEPIGMTCSNPLSEHRIIKEGVKCVNFGEAEIIEDNLKQKSSSIIELKKRNEQLEAMLKAGSKQSINSDNMLKRQIDRLQKEECELKLHLDVANKQNKESLEFIESLQKEIKDIKEVMRKDVIIVDKLSKENNSLKNRESSIHQKNELMCSFNDELKQDVKYFKREIETLNSKVSKEKLFKNAFLVMFLISFLTLVAISLKY